MATSFFDRWLSRYDPLLAGASALGVLIGQPLLAGIAAIVPGGLHVLFRAEGATVVEAGGIPVGAVAPSSAGPETVAPLATFPLAASTTYWFWVRACGPGGILDTGPLNALRIETDGAGVPIEPVPNSPHMLAVYPLAGGYFRLQWRYDPTNQQVSPASFNVYHDNGTGTVSYAAAIADTGAHAARVGPYAHGTTVKFVVRAASRAGNEETNTYTVSAVADTEGPPDLPAPTLTEGTET